ncbi:chemotaxis protein CheB [Ectothiorhodospira shaposhnikovii]|uniref:chemotaxis protein CheB n=1 Tax=Ectothiorhodospira shaposhnikovii TaxID=1054 RepID=UPI0039A16AE2
MVSPAPTVIVGIGASAGGLEALEHFLTPVPADCPLAFVVVQHRLPDHGGLLPELLQKATPLPVREAQDHMPVRPGEVYVIPPGKNLSVQHGQLHLLEPPAGRGAKLPIDFFLHSLATDKQARSVGVILSGSGCDGTLGLRAIREHGGITLAQSPEEARFPDMPRSVIDAGVVDLVLPASAMFERITHFLGRHHQGDSAPWHPRDGNLGIGLEEIIVILRARTGHDFTHYKTKTLCRRIERRMGLHQLDSLPGYIQYLRNNPQEVDLLFQELLIGVTHFFRDPPAWEALIKQALIPMIQRAGPLSTLRAWVAGCSTGEEAYSLAIAFREALETVAPTGQVTLQIFATDLNEELQSTNEELTTSKEEMQSLNEELQTMNAQLQAKLEELTEANSDMNNLFNSTDVATIFLSSNLTIRRFTSPAQQIFKLLPGDVGRPLSDIVTDLDYPDLFENAREVLQTLTFSLEEIPTRDGRWYQVKIMPYRTLDDVIAGVVISFSDITKAKTLESRLRALTSCSGTNEEAGKHEH